MAPELTGILDDIIEPVISISDEGASNSTFKTVPDPVVTKESDVYAFSMLVIQVRMV